MGEWPRRLVAMALVAALTGTTGALAIPYPVVVVYLSYEGVSQGHVVHWTGTEAPPPPDPVEADPPGVVVMYVPTRPSFRGPLASLPVPV